MPYGRRRRRYGAAPAQPKRVKIQLPPKPNLKDLKQRYEGYVVANQDLRIKALFDATEWFKEAADYLIAKSQIDLDLGKELQGKISDLTKAIKCVEQAVDVSLGNHNRETALKLACQRYETYCSALSPIAKKDKQGNDMLNTAGAVEMTLSIAIKDYIQKYEDQKIELEARDAQSAAKYAELLISLKDTFTNAPFKFKVTEEVQARKLIGSEFCYPKPMAQDMVKTLRKEGILKLVAQELPHIGKAMAVVEEDGRLRIDPKKQIEAMDQLFKDFVLYCQRADAPGRIIRKGDFGGFQQAPPVNPQPQQQNAPQPNVASPRPPRQPRHQGQPRRGNRVAGKYKAGSTIGTIFQRMLDMQEHTKAELFAGFKGCESGHSAPFTRILRHGHTIEVKGNTVKLVQINPNI